MAETRQFDSVTLDKMVENVACWTQAGGNKPAFTMLLGSGFSFPIIPTPSQMLAKDIAWWLYWQKQKKGQGKFTDRPAIHKNLPKFEKDLWKQVQKDANSSFDLDSSGLPDGTRPENAAAAYKAMMSGQATGGLATPDHRRRYLRDVIARARGKVNGAHLYLADILSAQDGGAIGGTFCRTIFTTNFDPLLQISLQLVRKLYYMTDRPHTLEPPDDEESEAIHLIYSHGSIHRYVLLNTESEIEAARRRNAPSLVPYFEKHGVIVMGYSGWNDATMAALRNCSRFAWNLYWCDRWPADQAPARSGKT